MLIASPLARAACSAQHRQPQLQVPNHLGYRITKSEPFPSIGLASILEKIKKEVQITCTCSARAMCTPGQLFMWRLDAPVQLCQCAKFGVASSKIHKLGGSHV